MRAASGAHRDDPVQVEHSGLAQEVRVLGRVDVIGHHGQVDVVAQRPAQRRDQCGLAATDRAADADPQRPPRARRRGVVDAVVMQPVPVVVLVRPVVRNPCQDPRSGLKETHLRVDVCFG